MTIAAALLLLLPSAQDPLPIGGTLEATPSLRDLRGNRRPLAQFKDVHAFVVVFLGTDCPVASLYLPRLIELHQRYAPHRVKFLAVYPNEQDTLDSAAAHAADRGIPFLVLRDFGQKLASTLGVERTPEVAVLDANRVLRYRGRIDDQYGAASRKEKPERTELVDALEDLLKGRAPRTAAADADGCLINRKSSLPAKPDATFARDVAPILQKRCQACHRPGQIGPFPLLTFEDAADHAATIREVVVQRRMPPWHADPRHGTFSNDRRLTPEEVGTIKSWVDAGAPRGDAKDLPPPLEWPKDWTIGTPDAVVSLPQEQDVPAEGVMNYVYLTVPTGFAEDRWVTRAEIRPGNAKVVHHVLLYLKLPGREIWGLDGSTTALVGWAPGDMPLETPAGTATKIPREAQFVWEIHYTPNGIATKDRTSVGLVFAKEPPARETRMNILAKPLLSIPAGAPHHAHESTHTFREDVRLLTLMPHMHLRGKSYRYEALYPDGRTETLLSVPRWDFNWQSVYRFETPVALPKGTKLRQTAHWDNSADNPLNPDPTKTVKYGLQTFEEMMNGWAQYVPEKADR